MSESESERERERESGGSEHELDMETQGSEEGKHTSTYWDAGRDIDVKASNDELRRDLDIVVDAEIEAEVMAKRKAEDEADVEAEVEATVSAELEASSSSDRELTTEATIEQEEESKGHVEVSSSEVLLDQENINKRLSQIEINIAQMNQLIDASIHLGHGDGKAVRTRGDNTQEEGERDDKSVQSSAATEQFLNIGLERDTTTPLHLGGDEKMEVAYRSNGEGEEEGEGEGEEFDDDVNGSNVEGTEEKEEGYSRQESDGEEERQQLEPHEEDGKKSTEVASRSLQNNIQETQTEGLVAVGGNGDGNSGSNRNSQTISSQSPGPPLITESTPKSNHGEAIWEQQHEPNGISEKTSQTFEDRDEDDDDDDDEFHDSFATEQNEEEAAPMPRIRHDPILTNNDEDDWESESSTDEELRDISRENQIGDHPRGLSNNKLYSYPDYVATPELSKPNSSNFAQEVSSQVYPLPRPELHHEDKIVLPKHNKQASTAGADFVDVSNTSSGSATSSSKNSGLESTSITPRRVSSHQYSPFRVVSVSGKGARKTSGGNSLRPTSGVSSGSGETGKNVLKERDIEAIKMRREEERAAREQQREEEEERLNLLRLEKKYELLTNKCNKLAKEVRYLTRMLGEGKLSIEDSRKLKVGLERLQEYLDKKTKEKYETGVLLSRQLRRRIDRGENGQFWIGNK